MQTKLKLLVLCFLLTGLFSCKDYDLDPAIENSYRISRITENNTLDAFVKIHTFTYENDKLVQLKSFFEDENSELKEFQKVTFSYGVNKVHMVQHRKQNGSWAPYQSYELQIQNNRPVEKVVSRSGFPECEQCWKYVYKYRGNQLSGVSKYIKDAGTEWSLVRQDLFEYDGGVLDTHELYMASSGGNLKLDYLEVYTSSNGKCAGCISGIMVDDNWQPSQKMEYLYENKHLASQLCYKRMDASQDWIFHSGIDYFYDLNGNLTERITSSGSGTTYEYEHGKGNSGLFLDHPLELIKKGILYL